MADPAWPCSTPETNYLRLVGPGAAGTATTIASGAAWQALSVTNELAFSASVLNTASTALNFEGVGGASSTATVTGLNTALQLLAGWAQEKPPIAASAVAAYETAVSSMIPAQVSIANRAEQATNVAINPAVLGALTPAIVALDSEYFGEHWPHNAGAGAAYGAALAALIAALAIPPPLAPLGAAATAPATAAAAAAQATGVAALNGALKESGQLTASGAVPVESATGAGQLGSMAMEPMQAVMGAAQPLMGMFSAPMQAFQGIAGMPQAMLGSVGGVLSGLKATDAAVPGAEPMRSTGLAGAGTGSATASSGIPSPGGYPGSGLTSYTRPTSSFAPENGGQATSAKHGLLSAETRGPIAASGPVGAMPLSPGNAGMLGHARGGSADGGKSEVTHARITLQQSNSRVK